MDLFVQLNSLPLQAILNKKETMNEK